MTARATVSVVLVNWNSAQDCAECIVAISREETKALDVEFIVVDNASELPLDGILTLANDGLNVKVFRQDTNLGFGRACNVGARHSSGDFLLFVNPDVLPTGGLIDGMLGQMTSDAEIGCIGVRHEFPDGSLQWSTDDLPSLANDVLHLSPLHLLPGFRRSASRYRRWSAHDEDADVGWVNGACFMMRTATFEVIGGFDERFFLFAEELDLCHRVWKAGYRVRFLASPVVIHHLGGSFSYKSTRLHRLALLNQAMLRYYSIHKSSPEYAMLNLSIRATAIASIAAATGMTLWHRVRPHCFSEQIWELLCQGEAGIESNDAIRAWWRVLLMRRDRDVRP
jgi:GT2 family glycosyltransferase